MASVGEAALRHRLQVLEHRFLGAQQMSLIRKVELQRAERKICELEARIEAQQQTIDLLTHMNTVLQERIGVEHHASVGNW